MNKPDFAKKRIIKMNIDRVDVVPAGANSASHIKLFKNKGGKKIMTFEEIMKSLDDDQAEIVKAEIKKRDDKIETLSIEKAELKKSKEEDQLTEEERIIKGLDGPAKEAFLKLKKERDEQIAKNKVAEEEKLEKEISNELSEIEFTKSVEGFEDSYKKLAKESPEMKDALLKIMKQVEAVVDTSELFKEYGSSQEGEKVEKQEEDKLEKLAKEKAKAESITFEKAYTMVLKDNPELYQD